jgi:peptidyl-tRNA hydrolase, PTH1 family
MTQQIKLIVGLGNPGKEYASTRHNAGAIFVEALANQALQTLKPESKFHGLYSKANISGKDIHLLIPTTFMNRSGQAVQAIAQFFKIQPEEILVAHDELDIPMGSMKLKKGGGHGGQNGLRDIITKFGGNKEFSRLRLGIGHPGHASKVTGHVLGKLGKKETEQLEAVIDEAIRYLPEIISGDTAKAMNALHSFKAD